MLPPATQHLWLFARRQLYSNVDNGNVITSYWLSVALVAIMEYKRLPNAPDLPVSIEIR